ncbi:MAG: 30S ribosomal protein S4 [Planctomycetes bacterium]|nr:30S ribosomal protein S4 [Planctomycetota bacterium]
MDLDNNEYKGWGHGKHPINETLVDYNKWKAIDSTRPILVQLSKGVALKGKFNGRGYTGPRLRITRRLSAELPGFTTKVARRQYAPGHAAASNRRFPKLSEHALRLREKQKLRFHYGLTEKQLRLTFKQANRMGGDAGKNMIELLESRFDNLVWRSGFTRTIPAARQLIAHGHVSMGQRRAKTPSQKISTGQSFQLSEKCLARQDIRLSANSPITEVPSGLNIDLDKMAVTVEALPNREQCPVDVNIQKVIEFYAR